MNAAIDHFRRTYFFFATNGLETPQPNITICCAKRDKNTLTDLPIYLHALVLSGAVFLALWPVSLALRDVGVVDAWWGPGFGAAALVVWWVAGAPDNARAVLLLSLILIWSLRLGVVMVRRWFAHAEEDRRYRMIRRSWGRTFWWKCLFIVFGLQGVMQWLVALGPLSGIIAAPAPLDAFAVVGLAIALAGLALETVADAQLDKFKQAAPEGGLLTSGLRTYVRHPNYSGEILFWWGVWLIVAPVAPVWAILSPILLTALLTKVSGAPILAETLMESRAGFAEYAARTPAFIPSFSRRERCPAE